MDRTLLAFWKGLHELLANPEVYIIWVNDYGNVVYQSSTDLFDRGHQQYPSSFSGWLEDRTCLDEKMLKAYPFKPVPDKDNCWQCSVFSMTIQIERKPESGLTITIAKNAINPNIPFE